MKISWGRTKKQRKTMKKNLMFAVLIGLLVSGVILNLCFYLENRRLKQRLNRLVEKAEAYMRETADYASRTEDLYEMMERLIAQWGGHVPR